MGTYRRRSKPIFIYFNWTTGTGAIGNGVSAYFHSKLLSGLMGDIVLTNKLKFNNRTRMPREVQ